MLFSKSFPVKKQDFLLMFLILVGIISVLLDNSPKKGKFQEAINLIAGISDENSLNTLFASLEDENAFAPDIAVILESQSQTFLGDSPGCQQIKYTIKVYNASTNNESLDGNSLIIQMEPEVTIGDLLNGDIDNNNQIDVGESDIWYVDILENGNYGKPINMGAEINTQERETFPFISDTNKLFFSSDGHLGLGGLDVFMASFNDGMGYWSIQNLGQPINSNQDDFGFIVREDEKIGYLSSNRGGTGGSSFDDIYAVSENCNPIIYGAVTDVKTGKPLEGSMVYLIDKDNNIVSQKITEQNGNYAFEENIACENQYVVRASNNEKEYEPLEKVINTPSGSMSIQVDLALVPPDCPVNDLGCRLDLQPIYFNFDKHNIRPDAEVELAKILQAMKQYPQLNIHIESHTDSRGDDNYNMQLSERRAKSTLEWLVEKGIDRKRLTSKGYGESQLINNCFNGEKCSEEAHQLNRRSMFIIK